MLHATPTWQQTAWIQRLRVQKHRWWRPLLWAGLLALALLLAWQVTTSSAMVAADTIGLNTEWRFVDESKPGAPIVAGSLTPASVDAPTQVAARFDISSTMQALALQLHHADLGGLPLAQVETMDYCTRLVDGPRPFAVMLQINVDADVTDGDQSWQGRLVYTPSYNGAVIQGEWQCWNTLVGRWWATGGPIAEYAPVDNPQPLGTLLARFPHLGINAAYNIVALKAGDGWHDFSGEASPVVIGVEGESIRLAFGTASQENEILLPVLFNVPQSGKNASNEQDKSENKQAKNEKEKKAKEDKGKKDKDKKEKDEQPPDQENNDPERAINWNEIDWQNFDWENFDWENVDWEHLDWSAFGWQGVRADEVRAFVEDVKGCKKYGWEDRGFKNQGQCVAYYVSSHRPVTSDWNNGGWGRTWNYGESHNGRDSQDD